MLPEIIPIDGQIDGSIFQLAKGGREYGRIQRQAVARLASAARWALCLSPLSSAPLIRSSLLSLLFLLIVPGREQARQRSGGPRTAQRCSARVQRQKHPAVGAAGHAQRCVVLNCFARDCGSCSPFPLLFFFPSVFFSSSSFLCPL